MIILSILKENYLLHQIGKLVTLKMYRFNFFLESMSYLSHASFTPEISPAESIFSQIVQLNIF